MNRPNIILIDAHDVGDWLRCYGRFLHTMDVYGNTNYKPKNASAKTI